MTAKRLGVKQIYEFNDYETVGPVLARTQYLLFPFSLPPEEFTQYPSPSIHTCLAMFSPKDVCYVCLSSCAFSELSCSHVS